MNILALDTSSSSGSIAISSECKIIYISYLDIQITHSERILPQIETALNESGIGMEKIDVILYSNGPGSFTGIRIGLATAKGLCFSREIPLIPVNTLELLAFNLLGNKKDILSFMDARMGEVYAALYSSDLQPIIAPCNTTPEAVLSQIKNDVVVVGDAYQIYKGIFENKKVTFTQASVQHNIPLASSLIGYFYHKGIKEGYDFNRIADLEPYYLRKSQAELVRETREKT